MPVHDWTRVKAGIFHDFHNSWIVTLKSALNDGLLPDGYYALAEQIAGDVVPDVLTLQASTSGVQQNLSGSVAVEEVLPQVAIIADGDEIDEYARRQQTLVIRHSTDDAVVALTEIVSRGNKQSTMLLQIFVNKALSALYSGIHLLIIDLFPPGRHNAQGIHAALWKQLQSESYRGTPGKPLTLAAYEAKVVPRAYVQPISPGSILPDMPLFIAPGRYVNVPLERTYMQAYGSVPKRWRAVIEGREAPVHGDR